MCVRIGFRAPLGLRGVNVAVDCRQLRRFQPGHLKHKSASRIHAT